MVQLRLGTIVRHWVMRTIAHNRVWTQYVLCGHKYVWAQKCLDMNISGHSDVVTVVHGHKRCETVTVIIFQSHYKKRVNPMNLMHL